MVEPEREPPSLDDEEEGLEVEARVAGSGSVAIFECPSPFRKELIVLSSIRSSILEGSFPAKPAFVFIHLLVEFNLAAGTDWAELTIFAFKNNLAGEP